MELISLSHAGNSYLSHTAEDLLSLGIPSNVINNALAANLKKQRYNAYLLESDPLYMEWKYDQTTEKEQAWRDKVAEIKQRYPLPVAE